MPKYDIVKAYFTHGIAPYGTGLRKRIDDDYREAAELVDPEEFAVAGVLLQFGERLDHAPQSEVVGNAAIDEGYGRPIGSSSRAVSSN